MIETACELTEGRITGAEIRQIIDFARDMLASPVELLDGVKDTIEHLAGRYSLMVITKGDLLDQEAKVARSGLGEHFDAVEIVSGKTQEKYLGVLERNGIAPSEFLMVGNSLRSDILPVLQVGARALHIPYESEWFHEKVADDELIGLEYGMLDSITEMSGWLEEFIKTTRF